MADLLKLDAQTVRTWIRSKYLPAVKIGRSWRIDRADLNRMLEAQRNVQDKPQESVWHQPAIPSALSDSG